MLQIRAIVGWWPPRGVFMSKKAVFYVDTLGLLSDNQPEDR